MMTMHPRLAILLVYLVTCRARNLAKPMSGKYPAPSFYGGPPPPLLSSYQQRKTKDELRVNYQARAPLQVGGKEVEILEGDIISPPPASTSYLPDGTPILTKGSLYGLWPRGRVPYTFSKEITGYRRTVIKQAMQHWSTQTCITFEEKGYGDMDYIEFMDGGGCFSDLGKVGGKQSISIGSRCVSVGIVVHEIGHAIGFYHEHSRPDRDNFVRIELQNVKRGGEDNFKKYSWDYIDTHGLPYDFGSIMHYRSTAFSRNGQPTITSRQKNGHDDRTSEMGQRVRLSVFDLELARTMYNCEAEQIDIDVEELEEPTAASLTSCEDTSTMCGAWAAEGMCTTGSYVVFMLKNCQVSCGICKSGGGSGTQTRSPLHSVTLKLTQVRPKTLTLTVKLDKREEEGGEGGWGAAAPFIHIMYKPRGSVHWYHGMYRQYIPEKPVYTIKNLTPSTEYDVTIRYSLDYAKSWSDFAAELTGKTRRLRRKG